MPTSRTIPRFATRLLACVVACLATAMLWIQPGSDAFAQTDAPPPASSPGAEHMPASESGPTAEPSLSPVRSHSGAVTVTNNGISLLPNFSLGKPAAIFDLSVGNGRLKFQPQLRFALEGKPWVFLFWWRYQLADTPRFRLSAGFHPGVIFRERTLSGGETAMVSERNLAAEITPTWILGRRVSVGAFYLHGEGIESFARRHTDFVGVRGSASGLRLTDTARLAIAPQVYFLRMNDEHGFYTTANL